MRTFFLTITFVFLLTACADNNNPVSLCSDTEYVAFTTDSQTSTLGSFDVIENTSPSLISTTFNTLSSVSYTGSTFRNKAATFDAGTNTIAYVDENNNLLLFNTQSNTSNIVALASSNFCSAPIFLNGDLYVMEFVFSSSYLNPSVVHLKEVTNLSTGALSTPLLTFDSNVFPLTSNVMGEYYSSTSNKIDKLYIMSSQQLLEVDTSNNFSYTIKNLPNSTNEHYYGLEYRNANEILCVVKDQSNNNAINLVSLDFTTTAITESILIPNLDVNFESVSLAFKDCGDALIVLTHSHYNSNSSKVLEINLSNNAITTRDFTEFIFGFIHKS